MMGIDGNRIRTFLLYGGINRSDYDSIRPMLWQRNLASLRITAFMAAGIGAVFLVINYFIQSGNQIPYLVLLCGSLLTLGLLPLVSPKRNRKEIWSLLLCYGQMILICGYATFLSTLPANYGIPATSAIVFIALLPLSIDDRPLRMFAVMLCESMLYLLFSYGLKSPHAFSLDAMNAVTFCLVGMVLYSVICARNIRELYQSRRIEHMSFQTIQTLANAIDAKDPYTRGHSTRVSQYAVMIAEMLGWKQERINDLRYAALLHDVGKIGVPDSILYKPTKLTKVEYDIIKSHTAMGAEILRERDINDAAEDVAYSHHERYDGKGYPRGLRGDEITEEARIVGIADAFDAMSSERVYRSACDRDYILRQLEEGRGKQFDPAYADILIDLWNQGRLEESLQSIPGWQERSEVLETSLHEAVESFVSEQSDAGLLMADIKQEGNYEGALDVGYHQFTKLYEFIVHLEKRFNHHFKLILITLVENPGEDYPAMTLGKAMFYMERAIRISIRDVDIVTQYNQRQFLVILVGTDLAGVKIAADRIFKSYFKMNGSNAFSLSYSIVETKSDQ
ncbi:MAG: HD-GYP domain-containing protein [Clostridia bacterium]|nr:HD-GYP domain-containing protein [Clostridia bacterium]